MNREDQIKTTEGFVREKVTGYDSSHDWWHVMRVRNLAHKINEKEEIADSFTLDIAALLHDAADSKFQKTSTEESLKAIGDFMTESGLDRIRNQVIEVISNISFSNKNPTGNLKEPVLLIIQDADRLDAMGAIGIARAFSYGGYRNRPFYIPDPASNEHGLSTIAHFHDKLLKLKEMMNTRTGRLIAEERHAFLEKYLEQFIREWSFAESH